MTPERSTAQGVKAVSSCDMLIVSSTTQPCNTKTCKPSETSHWEDISPFSHPNSVACVFFLFFWPWLFFRHILLKSAHWLSLGSQTVRNTGALWQGHIDYVIEEGVVLHVSYLTSKNISAVQSLLIHLCDHSQMNFTHTILRKRTVYFLIYLKFWDSFLQYDTYTWDVI